MSRLARALWIEIHTGNCISLLGIVEARESLVDWNQDIYYAFSRIDKVEARESLVDWNYTVHRLYVYPNQVEARESLVDWNHLRPALSIKAVTSRLARALWIEIPYAGCSILVQPSRLARALWIEIMKWCRLYQHHIVQARESLADQKIPVSP